MGGLLGGPKGMLPPPSQIIGGGLAPPGPPSSYVYELEYFDFGKIDQITMLTHKVTNKKKNAADNALFIFYFYLSEKIRRDVSCESSA